MTVLQADHALSRLADMGNDVIAFDGIFADQLGDGGVDRAFVIDKVTQAFFFKKGDAPAIGMVAGITCALGEARKAEAHIGWCVAVHSQ